MARPKRDNINREMFSVRVDSELARQYRHLAIDMKVSLSEIVERALRQYLVKPKVDDSVDIPAKVEAPTPTTKVLSAPREETPVSNKHNWPLLLEEFKTSGLSQAAFARARGIDKSSLSKRLKALKAPASNVPECAHNLQV